MLQLPQTRPRILSLSRTAKRLRQAMLLLRRHRTHPSRMPNATPTRLQPKMLRTSTTLPPNPHPSKRFLLAELRTLWTYRARVSE